MGRAPCCSKAEDLNRGAWTAKEDKLLTEYIKSYGEGGWRSLPRKAGLKRCGKSCRLRWMNYLRPNIKRGNISPDEEDLIVRLHRLLGNRWALIAGRLPGRTDNEIKNYWNTRLGKKRGMSESAYPNTRHKAVQEKQSTPAADLQNRPDNLGSSEKHYVKSPGSKNDIVRTRAVKYSGTVAVPDRRNVNAGNSQECRQFFDGGPVAEHNIPTSVSTNIPEIHPPSVEMHSENPCTSFSDLIYQEFTRSSENCLTAGHDSTFQCEMNLSKVSCRNGNFMMISSPCDSTSALEEFCTSSLTIEPANDLDQMSSLPHDNNNTNVDHTVNCFTAAADEQGMTEMYNNTLELVDWMHEEYLQNPASHVGDSRSENLWLKNYTQFAMNIISE